MVESRGWNMPAARSVATSQMIDAAATSHGQSTYQTPVGFKYIGQLIREEARRLGSMIEQILLFSAGKQNTGRYNLQPVDIVSVVEGVLHDTASAIASAGMTNP